MNYENFNTDGMIVYDTQIITWRFKLVLKKSNGKKTIL